MTRVRERLRDSVDRKVLKRFVPAEHMYDNWLIKTVND